MKVIFLCGLPCSGKTTLGQKLEEEIEDSIYIDDITVRGGLRDLYNAIHVQGWINIIVSDVFLCREKDREYAIRYLRRIAPEYETEFVFFENNPEKCFKNVEHRNKNGDSREVKASIDTLTRQYKIPEDAKVREIWQEGLF